MSSPASARRGATRLLVVAAAGYGKTAALEAELPNGVGCHRAVDLLSGLPPSTRHLAVDELDVLSLSDQERLMVRLGELGPDVRLALASRTPLASSVRSLMPGPVFERGPGDLALSPETVAQVLRDEHGVQTVELASHVHSLTGGWPALVQFAGDALTRGARAEQLLDALSEPGTAAATWIESQVLAGLSAPVRRVVGVAAELEVIGSELLAQIAGDLGREACGHLRRTGLLVPHPRGRGAAPLQLVPVVAAVVRTLDTVPLTHEALSAAASWYAAHDHPLAAARTLVQVGRFDLAAGLVESRGEEMLAAGEASGIVEIVRTAFPGVGCRARQQLYADALRMSGDAPAAIRAFAPQVEEAERSGVWLPALAWRVAMVRYMLADYHAALEVLDRVDAGAVRRDRDHVELLACRANVLSMLGREDEAVAVARTAVQAAELLGHDRAVAAAHLAAANTTTGPTKDAHLAQAFAAAERAGDVVLTARALLNQAYGLLGSAQYAEARDVAARAVRAAELGSPPGLLVVALHNLGESLRRLGRHADAELYLHRSVAISRTLGLKRTAFGLWGLAEIHRELGRREQSRIAYDAALDAARSSGEVQVIVPALSGLARLRAEIADELPLARAVAEEAEQVSCPEFAPYALLACGRVALAEGRREVAAERAAEALAAARASAAVDALAEALELTAVVEPHARRARAALQEALAIWAAGGAEPAADRVRVLLGRLPHADGSDRSDARDAAKRLLRLGIRQVDGRSLDSSEGSAAVEVRLLGGFDVRVGGEPVPVPAWRSKQARTLVKILASRRGRVVTRSEVCELLWPDDDPSKTGHRLSVLLSAVRGVLDPERAWPPDQFITADLSGLSLDVTHVRVDVEQFLEDSAHATELLRAGDLARAGEILAEVDGAYRGDALEDEPYAEWADGLREEARAAALRVLHNLAELRRRSGEHHEAATLLVRLLGADPYDETAHRQLVHVLVQTGRHGEARRAFTRWVRAMKEIDAPVPDGRILRPNGDQRVLARTAATLAS